jgi:hypothetical protein
MTPFLYVDACEVLMFDLRTSDGKPVSEEGSRHDQMNFCVVGTTLT